ncbi:MAG: hypothetical protein ACFFBX_04620 [Promethearchaeota archaeon]
MDFILYTLALVISYAFIGGGVKLLDHLTDQPSQHQVSSFFLWVLTSSLALVVVVWTLIDAYTAILALALVFGLIGAKKIDTRFFLVLALIIIPIGIISVFFQGLFLFLLPTLIALIPPVILDELIHSYATRVNQPQMKWILARRPLLKITVIILPFFSLLTFIHTIAFWCFDITYDLVNYVFRASSKIET